MKVEIEISGDAGYCKDSSGDMCKAAYGPKCYLALLYSDTTEESDCEYDQDWMRYKKCKWCLETFPVQR